MIESSSESSSSEESSSDDDDNELSDDENQDITQIHLNDNVLPAGCDKDLYDEAFALREEKYKIDLIIKEYQGIIDNNIKIHNELTGKFNDMDSQLSNDKKNLESLLVLLTELKF